MAWDPGFENEGTYAGDADGWTVTVTDSNWGWAKYGVKHWGIELFETDWNNDDYIWSFSPSDLDFAEFDPDNKFYEPFLYFGAGGTLLTYLENWGAISDDPAEFDTTPEDFEDFEEDWNNDPWYPAFTSWVFGTKSENFSITTGANKLGIKLEHTVNPDFDAVLEITAGSYTAAALKTELQTKVNAALTAAGAPYAANDIIFQVHPGDSTKLSLYNNKAGYIMRLYESSDDGWPSVLGYSLTWLSYRYYEADLLDSASYAWVGKYNSATNYEEQFERGFNNDETSAPWDFNKTLADFIDGSVTEPPGDYVIQTGVNDKGSLRYRYWVTGQLTTTTLTVPAATYTLAQLVTQLQTLIDAWLTGAGAPFGAGDIDVLASPTGTVRFRVDKPALAVLFVTDVDKTLWDYIGMQYDDPNHVEQYLHPDTARWPEGANWDRATFDVAPEFYEDFEEDW